MTNRLDDIVTELLAVSNRLAELPDDAFDERVTLNDRMSALRAEAHAIRQEQPEQEEALRSELQRLERAWDDLQERRIDLVQQAGGAGGGDFGATAVSFEVNQRIDQQGSRQALEERIRQIKAKLQPLDT